MTASLCAHFRSDRQAFRHTGWRSSTAFKSGCPASLRIPSTFEGRGHTTASLCAHFAYAASLAPTFQ